VTGARRPVYSTDRGRLCPVCGWPEGDCRCSANLARVREEPVPSKIAVKLRLEKRGSGKSVTVVNGLPRNGPFLEELARELKTSCGAGGRVGDDSVEIQGDQRERLAEILSKRGWVVKDVG